jgi:hypothetical protein
LDVTFSVRAKGAAFLILASGLSLSRLASTWAAELAPTPQAGIGVWYAPGAAASALESGAGSKIGDHTCRDRKPDEVTSPQS